MRVSDAWRDEASGRSERPAGRPQIRILALHAALSQVFLRRVEGLTVGWLGTRFPSGSYRTDGTDSSWIV